MLIATVKRIEADKDTLVSTQRSVQQALEQNGIVFVDTTGVNLRTDDVATAS